jgi:periplasmic protein TonB
MFETALIESSAGSPRGSSLWTKGLSFVLELSLVGLAVLAPLLYTEALPKHVLSDITGVPAAPPPAAPPRTPAVATHSQVRTELSEGRVLLPTAIPRRIKEIHDEAEPSGENSGGVNGVPFGAPGGTGAGDATIASLIRSLPATVPKNVAPHNVRISSGVAQGLLIHEVRPQYPALARSARVQGTVILQATIGKDGTIQNLHLLSGHPLLSQAAIDAVRQWRFRPYLLNNEPVEVDTTIQVNFTLNSGG